MKTKSCFRLRSLILAVIALFNAIAAVFFLDPFKVNGCEAANDYIVLQVQDNKDEPNYAGFKLKKNDNSKSDLLTYSQFYSSFATVSINGKVSLFSEGEKVKDIYTDNDGSIVSVQNFDGIEITQRLSFATGNSKRADMLNIVYTAKNNTDAEVLVSVRLLIDPTLENSESDPVIANEISCINETVLTGDNIPKTWCIRSGQGDIKAYGISSDGKSEPDIFQAANWNNLYNNRFDYTVDEGMSITDNAVALTWSDRKVSSGGEFSCGTKYGLYSKEDSEYSDAKMNSPKTGDNIGSIFAFLSISLFVAALLLRKRGEYENE